MCDHSRIIYVQVHTVNYERTAVVSNGILYADTDEGPYCDDSAGMADHFFECGICGQRWDAEPLADSSTVKAEIEWRKR